jgi:hypothetical protein
MKTPTQRTTEWRKAKIEAGYEQKAFLLSPRALIALAQAKKHFPSATDAIEAGLVELARSLSPTGKG